MKNDMPTKVLSGSSDIARTVLSVLLIILLIGVSLWVLRPFLLAAIWGTMIVVATWPLMLKVQAGLRKRAFAVTVMTVAMLMVFVVPMFLAIRAFVVNLDTITQPSSEKDVEDFARACDDFETLHPLTNQSIAEDFDAAGVRRNIAADLARAADATRPTEAVR